MSREKARFASCTRIVVLSIGVLALTALTRPALASDIEAIVKALTPKPPAAQSQAPLTRGLAKPGSRGIGVEGGESKPEPPPSIDLYVHFEYDEGRLTKSDALLTLDSLGKALKDPRLAGMRFQVIGHTDAKGGDDYNLRLSQKRAESVRLYLISAHQIEAGRLTAEGRGRRELKDPSRPEDGINRRVQIKTITDKTS
jgi:outer membrane protein OmpA-like peptidoglycan-associated protein